MNITTEESDDGLVINYTSKHTVNMSGELHTVDNWKVVYSPANVMSSCDIKSKLNDRTRIDIVEGASDAGVIRVVNGKSKQELMASLEYSYVPLCTKEPVVVPHVYSELYGENFTITGAEAAGTTAPSRALSFSADWS